MSEYPVKRDGLERSSRFVQVRDSHLARFFETIQLSLITPNMTIAKIAWRYAA